MTIESQAIPYGYEGQMGSQVTDKAGSYNPTPEEEKAIKLVEKCFSKAKAARKVYDEKWLDYYKMFRGRQWKDSRPSYRHSEVINLIFRAIQSEVPILTDRLPRPTYIPQEPQDFPLANVLNDVIDADWTSGNWDQKFTEIVYDGHFYGAGFGSLKYDEEAMNGAGRIVFKSEEIFAAYPSPTAKNVNEENNYFVMAEPKEVEELKREYPDKAQYIKPDLIDIARRDKAHFTEQTRYKSPTDNRAIVEGGQTTYDLDSTNEALRLELMIHDHECIEEEKNETNAQGELEILYVQKLKYPQGRKIVTINGVLCEDGPLEFEDKKFPYLRWLNYILPREFWGISEVEQLESPQKIFNKLISFSLDVLTLMGNPVWIVDSGSGVDTDNLTNRPGLIIEKEPGSEVRREEGVQLQPYVLQMIDRMKIWFDDVSGSNDVSRGAKPEGVTAASAIQALQEAAQTRLRQKTRNIDAFMQDFGQMYLSRVMQYYTAPRVFRLTNDQNVTRYFKFHVDTEPVIDEMTGQVIGEKRVAKVRNYEQSPVDGQYYLGEEQQYNADASFDVKISTGSSLPFEKDRIEQQSYALFDRQIIDAEEVLKNIKYPNYEEVLKRQSDRAALMAQQAPPVQA